jgi:hypothetical protein
VIVRLLLAVPAMWRVRRCFHHRRVHRAALYIVFSACFGSVWVHCWVVCQLGSTGLGSCLHSLASSAQYEENNAYYGGQADYSPHNSASYGASVRFRL